MPFEIIMAVFIEWTMWDWFAPAIASQVCQYFKKVADTTPRVWFKLILSRRSRATADDVRAWLKRAKAVPKEICLETQDISLLLAALESAKDTTSLIYRIKDIPPPEKDIIRLPTDLLQLRHLIIDASNTNIFRIPSSIFGLYNNPTLDAHFPCLTTMRLFSVDLIDFDIMPGLFPVLRRLVLFCVCGPILDLITHCKGLLEDLRVSCCDFIDPQLYLHGRICLPNLKVLTVDATRELVPNLEAPNLRLLNANLDEIDGNTKPFPSVVEWVTRQDPEDFLETDITSHLNNMPHLQCLMLLRHIHTLVLCFGSLGATPTICPHLRSIEVVDFVSFTTFKLEEGFKALLEVWMAPRAANVPGFTLEFVKDSLQLERLEHYHLGEVCLFIFMPRCLSYHASRNPLTRWKPHWRASKQTCLPLFVAKIGTICLIPATPRITVSLPSQARIAQHSSSKITILTISPLDIAFSCTFR